MANELLTQRWSLRDFGSLQFLWDSFSGEYVQVYGPEAVRHDGPWKLEVFSGKAELVRIAEEGEAALRLDPEELAALKVRSEGGKLMVADERDVFRRQTAPLRQWLDSSRCKSECKALVLPVDGFKPFECVCSWEAVPHICGDKPVCIWMDFKWLVDFVFGKKATDKTWSFAGNLLKHVGKLGLDESHVQESARSQASKRRRTEGGASPEQCSGTASEWRVSVLGALLFLEHAAFSKAWASSATVVDNSGRKAAALLSALLQWPRHGETDVAFALPKTECQLLLSGMQIDQESLDESEKHLRKARTALKIGSLVDTDHLHLFDMFAERRSKLRWRSRLPASKAAKLDLFLVELFEVFADLFETTRACAEWSEKDILDMAVLTTPAGRCRAIPSSYKTSVVDAVRDNGGLAGRTISSLVHGMARKATKHALAGRKLNRKRVGFSKMLMRHAVRTAKSQSSHAHPGATNLEARVKQWERLKYFRSGQRLAAKQHRLSLAMDATDVAYKKVLNATMCLPAIDRVMWLPPMDFG
jgi:hypothetical protein